MNDLPNCQQCDSAYAYEDRGMVVCPECGHEWVEETVAESKIAHSVKDAYGNKLQDGDTITVIKDLKVKGASTVVKGWHKSQKYSPGRR